MFKLGLQIKYNPLKLKIRGYEFKIIAMCIGGGLVPFVIPTKDWYNAKWAY
jgi:hypothetical protein